MSEKEAPETIEEQVHEEVAETTEAVEASQEDSNEVVEAAAEEANETTLEAPPEKKGLMERRPSFAQSSVPNAHRGYSTTPPVIMLLIISVFVLLSIIFATAAVGN